ncbi:MAG: zf-TFIIB domain-containing protein [Spirochaetes bacterium]|nr:zf-TFIIB domain-containing protein [Spirochaetota bacterium]
MNCPKCNTYMEKQIFDNIEIEKCASCNGIWFDFDEKETLKKLKNSESIDTGNAEVGKIYNETGDINCPKCGVKMVKMVDINQHHIWYESCIDCSGSFFDAGEFKDYKEINILDKIKDLLTPERS